MFTINTHHIPAYGDATFRSRKLYFLCDSKNVRKYQENPPNDWMKALICDVDMMFGYSISSLKVTNDQTFIAAGGPRANGMKGEIQVFRLKVEDLTNSVPDSFDFKTALRGSVLNSGFGTTMAGADIDGDGIDELIVGEPYYTVKLNFILSSLQRALNLVLFNRTI